MLACPNRHTFLYLVFHSSELLLPDLYCDFLCCSLSVGVLSCPLDASLPESMVEVGSCSFEFTSLCCVPALLVLKFAQLAVYILSARARVNIGALYFESQHATKN